MILAAQASPFLDMPSQVLPVLASAYRSLEGKRAEMAAPSPGKAPEEVAPASRGAAKQGMREVFLCIFMKCKGLHLGCLLCGEGLLHATCVPSRRKASLPCPELLGGALPQLVATRPLRPEQQKPRGGARGGRPRRWLSARALQPPGW